MNGRPHYTGDHSVVGSLSLHGIMAYNTCRLKVGETLLTHPHFECDDRLGLWKVE